MESYKGGSLEIVASRTGSTTSLIWKGKSDDRNPSVSLDPYFDGILEVLKGTELTVDFMSLEYMNSSTVPPIIKFCKKLNSNNINAVFKYDASSKWQAATFKAFETFSRMLPHLTIDGK